MVRDDRGEGGGAAITRLAPLCRRRNRAQGADFPYGDLGEAVCAGRVDRSGVIRWVEVYRECDGVAMHEELPNLAEYLTDNEVADARSPRYSNRYPECDVCARAPQGPIRLRAAGGLSAAHGRSAGSRSERG